MSDETYCASFRRMLEEWGELWDNGYRARDRIYEARVSALLGRLLGSTTDESSSAPAPRSD